MNMNVSFSCDHTFSYYIIWAAITTLILESAQVPP